MRRRQQAIRRLVDDPGIDPRVDDYLQSSIGRNRALNVLHALGLVGTVRRDWWQVSDPSGLGSALDFPNGRRSERQAALALLEHLGGRSLTEVGHERHIAIGEIVSLFQQVRVQLPRWAAAYDQRLSALANAATGDLVAAGFLIAAAPADDNLDGSDDVDACCWLPTPAVRLWRIKINSQAAAPVDQVAGKDLVEVPLSLLDGDEGAH